MLDTVLGRIQESVEGVDAVFVVGMDGMIVTGKPTPVAAPWDWIAASYTEIVRKIAAAHGEAGMPLPEELVITGGGPALVLRRVTEEYVLLLALRPEAGSLGRARFELRKAASALAPELVS